MTSPYTRFLNAENYDRIFETIKEFNLVVDERDQRIRRIVNMVDTEIKYPAEPADTSREDNDNLRNLLDHKYKLSTMEGDELFQHVEDDHIRQLLRDNYKLTKIKAGMVQENSGLLAVDQQYRDLILNVLLPELSKSVCGQNEARLIKMRESGILVKLDADKMLWDKYCEYLENLTAARELAKTILNTYADYLDDDQMVRLTLQLDIVNKLSTRLTKLTARKP